MAELKEKFGEREVDVELQAGKNGVFDVKIDGELIYSKHQTGNFPRYREIVDIIERKKVAS